MLLKSSSTPLLVSLLSLSETTPNHHSYESTNTKHPSNSPFHFHSNNNKLSFSPLLSSNSSPISPSNFSDHDRFSRKGFRRAQSEGNLSTLARVSHSLDQQVEDQDQDPFFFNSNIDSYKPNKFSDRPKHLMLQSIPAFSMYNSRANSEEEEEEDWLEDNNEISDDDTKEETVVNTSEVNHHIDVNSKIINALILTPQDTIAAKDDTWITTGFQQEAELMSQKMHLARGLGIDVIEGGSGGGGGGKGKFNPGGCGGDGGEKYGNGMEEHHKNMVEQNPGNPLVLRNYAQFLYQSKGDLQGAEEYYSRAILIDSKDGEILSQYAKLVWELHHDRERASAYFHRAIQASPQDSLCQFSLGNGTGRR